MVLRYQQILDKTQPPLLLIVLILGGVVLFLLSFPLSIAFLPATFPGGVVHQVGYVPAVNWSIGIGFFAPLMIYFSVAAYRSISATLDSLATSKMIVDSSWKPVPAVEIAASWEATLRRCVLGPGLFLSAIVVLACIAEWVVTSAHPLAAGNYRIAAEGEFDWSVGVLLKNATAPVVARGSNALFSLVCFSLQALAGSCLVQFYLMCFAFAVFIQGTRIVPSLKSFEDRCGFENFEPFLENVLFAALFAALLFYSSRLQNAYLHSDRKDSSLLTFVLPDIIRGTKITTKNLGGLGSVLQSAFSDYSDAMVFIGGLVVVLGTLFIIFIVLRGSALEGRNRLTLHLENDPVDPDLLGTKTTQEGLTKLEQMHVWPLEYLSLNTLLLLSMLVVLSLLFYRVGLLFVGFALASIVKRLISDKKGGARV
jgi:hypothetical protein